MKQKLDEKVLNINIEYTSKSEMLLCIQAILQDMQNRNFDRRKKNNCLYEWGVSWTKFRDYRVEVINGERCMILPSKINKI